MPARFDHAKLDAAIAVLNQAAADGVVAIERGSALSLALDVLEERGPDLFSWQLWQTIEAERQGWREPCTPELQAHHALEVLHRAMLESSKRAVRTPDVSLALRVLRGRCPDDDLAAFWEDAGPAYKDGHRYAALTARYNRIVLLVRGGRR